MSPRRAVRAACVLAAAALLGGCAWPAARWRDFTDIASFGISAGSGLGARATVTRLLAVEAIAEKDETFYGWNSRNFRWTSSSYGIPFSLWRVPSVGREKTPERHWFDIFTTSRRRTLFPNRPTVEDRRHTLFILSGADAIAGVDWLNIEVGISALFGGLEISIKPGEMGDFFAGLIGLDPAGDDERCYGVDVPHPSQEPLPK